MRIAPWSNEAAPRDPALIEAVLKRRGGKFINLDLVLLWSEPLTRGWNTTWVPCAASSLCRHA